MTYSIRTLRRMAWQSWPRPMESESPSPEIPIYRRSRLAAAAPVAIEGMRPCAELKPCAPPTKYVGVLEEQPMPLSLAMRCGGVDNSQKGPNDGGGDGIVAAARAQRGHGAFVVADGQAQLVALQAGVGGDGFGDGRHGQFTGSLFAVCNLVQNFGNDVAGAQAGSLRTPVRNAASPWARTFPVSAAI